MTTTQQRSFVSDAETWEVFVGGITPREFCSRFSSADSAVSDYINNYPFDDEIPSWLRGSLIEYIESAQTEEVNEIDWFKAVDTL